MGRTPLTKSFDHSTEETSIYQAWETSGAFKPTGKGEPYFLPMPPPNITGILHMGHALFATLQDISTRYNRMRGRNTLWLPGTDHAGLATQAKLDQLMLEQGLDPQGPDFDAFAASYKANLKSTITGQLRRCGASADWSRETFTLDDGYSESVEAAMKKCHSLGLLYEEDGQWWIDMSGLAQDLLAHLDAGDLEIIPSGGEGTLRNFLNKIEPWCISRQIRWGHRMPIWKRTGLSMGRPSRINQFIVSATCPGDPEDWKQEEGCLDTWFSSALWPFATLGWPHDTEDMRTFYPAAMIETADDILFFWCARMLMMGLLLTDELPFEKIFLHGIIRDKDGQKMSKSLGNGIDPLEIIEKFGCDSMRFALAEDATPGQDMRMWDEKFQAGKALRTKIWNASRYAISHADRIGVAMMAFPSQHPDDISIRKRMRETQDQMTEMLEGLRYHEAAFTIRQFIFNDLCGTYIEQTKSRLYDDNDMAACSTLMETLDQTLRLLHPFMPYVTERIRSAYMNRPLISDSWV